MRLAWPILLAVFAGCTTTALDVFEVCQLDVVPQRDRAPTGALVTASGGPFTEVRDTRIEIGGFDAEVISVDFESIPGTGDTGAPEDLTSICAACEDCRTDAGCGPCGACAGELLSPSGRIECFGDASADPVTPGLCDLCQQHVTFQVPALSPGATTLWMINRNGSSPQVPFTVLGAPGTGNTATTASTADTGSSDTASGGSGAR